MKNKLIKQNNIICVPDDSGSPMIINMANVYSITAHKTLFGMPNPHICIVWNNETWTNLPMESYEDAENFIKDVYNRCGICSHV